MCVPGLGRTAPVMTTTSNLCSPDFCGSHFDTPILYPSLLTHAVCIHANDSRVDTHHAQGECLTRRAESRTRHGGKIVDATTDSQAKGKVSICDSARVSGGHLARSANVRAERTGEGERTTPMRTSGSLSSRRTGRVCCRDLTSWWSKFDRQSTPRSSRCWVTDE